MDENGWRPVVPPGRYVELPGRGRTFVRECAGPEGAPAVVLLHGWTATAALNWFPSFGPLATGFRVIAIDHRGHGRGLRGRGSFSLEDCADDVTALLDVLGVERSIVVGYSMGGTIAQLLSKRCPTTVTGLVLCATATTFLGTPREALLAGVAATAGVLAAMPMSRPLGRAAVTALRGWGSIRRSSWWGLDEIARHDWPQIVEAGREICRFDSHKWLPRTSVPTSVIAVRDDQVVPYRRQLALAGAIPGATLRSIDGGHSACTSVPERFVSALVDATVEVADRAA
jgi:pimeloyl-ACP methyl ester carboxylesterase